MRFSHLWILSAGYSGHADHQSDLKHGQREWNRWVVGLLEWVEDIPHVGMPSSRTFHWKWNGHKSNHGSNWLGWSCQSDKEGRNRCFSSKIIHARTKTMFSGSNMHVMMQALKGGDGPCLPHGWVSWIPTSGWLPGARELQLWWRTWLPLWSPSPRVSRSLK